ncbi:MAG: hypothetical protein Q8Q09_20575 [Deltaproteobacteria bacterium]|nr:hypothetical protein [Deltaproteobacteria bacterium]
MTPRDAQPPGDVAAHTAPANVGRVPANAMAAAMEPAMHAHATR